MLKKLVLFVLFVHGLLSSYCQVVTECPQNIGFESHTFSGWECYTGVVGGTTNPQIATGTVSLSSSGPVYNRHSLIKRGSGSDPYGGFSLDAPNGSEYVVKLGNNIPGAEAESISYTLTVPSDVDTYSIIFNYAVVFENPTHQPNEQPRFRATVIDLTTNSSTSCGSFDFAAPGNGNNLPGFAVSSVPGSNNSTVLYKPWSPVLVNLSEYIGHTIRLEFTTNDCTFQRHFGYAYIDFNENCSIPITGNVTCPDVESITLRTLPGFSRYKWFNTVTGEVLGTADSLVLAPTPAPGTPISVELVPYDGLGCTLILNTVIAGISMHIKDPPPNCSTNGVDLTDISLKVGNSSDLTYTYWKDSKAQIPVAKPRHIETGGTYYVKGTSSSGCYLIQPVNVVIEDLPAIQVTQPDPVVYPNTVDITKTFVHDDNLTYAYWTSADTTKRVANPTAIRLGGTFYIKGYGPRGCECTSTVTVDIIIPDMIIPNTFTPNGDGVNDVFTILVNSQYKIKSLRIFNRWGEPVFLTPDINNYWDGLKDSKMVPPGVYFWVMEGETGSQKRFFRSGYVTVVR